MIESHSYRLTSSWLVDQSFRFSNADHSGLHQPHLSFVMLCVHADLRALLGWPAVDSKESAGAPAENTNPSSDVSDLPDIALTDALQRVYPGSSVHHTNALSKAMGLDYAAASVKSADQQFSRAVHFEHVIIGTVRLLRRARGRMRSFSKSMGTMPVDCQLLHCSSDALTTALHPFVDENSQTLPLARKLPLVGPDRLPSSLTLLFSRAVLLSHARCSALTHAAFVQQVGPALSQFDPTLTVSDRYTGPGTCV